MSSLPIPEKINIFSPTVNNIMPGTTIGGVAEEQPQTSTGSHSTIEPPLQHHQPYPNTDTTPLDMEEDNSKSNKHTHLLGDTPNSPTKQLSLQELDIVDMDTPAESTLPTNNSSQITTSIPMVPVTQQRKPFISPSIPHAGTARANLAPSTESPNGTTERNWAKNHAHQTVLQQHCTFFDRDGDGVIWPHDTFIGFHRLGFGIFLSLLSVLIIHANFSYPTLDSWIPDPFFRLYLKNVHMDKHGSDTGTYDNEGRFVPQKFEEVFEKYAGGREWVTVWDVARMLKGQRCIADPIGWGGAFFEWTATYLLLWPEDGRMMKEDIRRIYDGSLFYVIAERRERDSMKRR